jgi:hypothetical protein
MNAAGALLLEPTAEIFELGYYLALPLRFVGGGTVAHRICDQQGFSRARDAPWALPHDGIY